MDRRENVLSNFNPDNKRIIVGDEDYRLLKFKTVHNLKYRDPALGGITNMMWRGVSVIPESEAWKLEEPKNQDAFIKLDTNGTWEYVH